MTRIFFVTGTDTNVGKTVITASLLHYFKNKGLKALGFKPVVSGGNEDTLLLQKNSSIFLEEKIISPFSFLPPIAPHLAAEKEKIVLSIKQIKNHYEKIKSYHPDIILIEGAGGWKVPLNDKEDFSDLACSVNASVILVVGMRLGCINHALMTVESIQAKGIVLHGWVANCLDPDML